MIVSPVASRVHHNSERSTVYHQSTCVFLIQRQRERESGAETFGKDGTATTATLCTTIVVIVVDMDIHDACRRRKLCRSAIVVMSISLLLLVVLWVWLCVKKGYYLQEQCYTCDKGRVISGLPVVGTRWSLDVLVMLPTTMDPYLAAYLRL